MSELASVIKKEVARLARKEVRSGTDVLKSSSAQYRRDIAELKRQVAALTRQVTYLERENRKQREGRVSKTAGEGRRFSARGLKSHRAKLGLSAADYGELVGVTAQTIYNWERGESRPRSQQLASLVEVRGLGKRDALRRLEAD